MLSDGGNVERLIPDTVAIPAAVQDSDEAEGCGAANQAEPPAGHF
jgi:hypothetical protein